MNNEEYEILDDISEHANLPKISLNTPSLFKKNSIEIIDKSCYNTAREELNLSKIINDKRKLTLKLESNPENKKVIYEKIYISNSNKNYLTKSQRLGKDKNIHKKIINNSPNNENLRNTIEIGNHLLYKKKIYSNGIVNSEPGKDSPQNISLVNKIMINEKDNNNQDKKEIKKNENKLNIRKNNKKNTINGNEFQQRPKIEKLNSENIILRQNKRTIKRSKDLNNIKYEMNKSLKIADPKEIVEQEINRIKKINIKKISIVNGRHIHSIKYFNSNSSQALFNNNNSNSVIIDKDIPKFKKLNSDFKENENENNLLKINSELNINSQFKRGNSDEIKNIFSKKINLKKRNALLFKSVNLDKSENFGFDMNMKNNKDNDNSNNIINKSKSELNDMKSPSKEEEQENLDEVLSPNVSLENEINNKIENKANNSKDKEVNNENQIENESENEKNSNNNNITEKNIDENEEKVKRPKRSRRLTLPYIKNIQKIKINNSDDNLKENNKESILNINENKNKIVFQEKKEQNEENLANEIVIKENEIENEKEIVKGKEYEEEKKNEKEKKEIEYKKESIEKENIKKENIEKESIEKESIEKESIEKESIEKENIEKESIEKENIEKGNEENNILKENILPINNEKIIKKEKNSKTNNNKKNKKKKKEKDIIINNLKSHYSLSKAGKDELGNSKTNQDKYLILTNINGIKQFNIFGVMDGHGPEGHLVSEFLSTYIELEFLNHPKLENEKNIETIYSILKSKKFEIIKKIFINADNALKKEDIDYKSSGTTCVLVIHIGEHIICANVGDSRAILIFDEENDENLNNIKVFPLSFDNKPENPQEKERIIRMGGTVEKIKNKKGHGVGPYRVWIKNKDYPGLAMSRSIGDFNGKKVGVIADPEIIEYNLSIYSKFITICSDGVWEFLNNEDVMNIGKKFYLENNPRGFCKELISKSIQYWEKEDSAIDDITAVIVFF